MFDAIEGVLKMSREEQNNTIDNGTEKDKPTPTSFQANILIGNGESIKESVENLVNEIKSIPQIDVERFELKIDVNRTFRYID